MNGRGSEIYKRMHRPGTTRWVLNRFDPVNLHVVTSLRQLCYAMLRESQIKRRVERRYIDYSDGGTYSSSDCGVCLCTQPYWRYGRCCWSLECESLGWWEEMYLGERMGREDDHGRGESALGVRCGDGLDISYLRNKTKEAS